MGSPFSIVNDDFATNWNTTHRTQSQRYASLGDPAKFNGEAYNAIMNAHRGVEDGLETIEALVKDPTRTEVSKHGVAKKVADRTVAILNASGATFTAVSKSLNNAASTAVEEAFAIDPLRTSIHSEIRRWIRETAKAENGLAAIRKAMDESVELAAVLYHSPNFLIGLAPDVRANMVADGVDRYVPKAGAMLNEAEALAGLTIRYDNVGKAVRRAFYSPALAEQSKLRVEVE